MANLNDLALGGQTNTMNQSNFAQQHPIQYGLSALANIASSTANPQTERGQILGGMGNTFIQQQQMQKQNQFMKSINDIMGSNSPIEDSTGEDGKSIVKGRKSQLLQVLTSNPDLVKGSPLEEVQTTLMKEFGKPKGSMSIVSDTNIPEGMEVTGYDQKGQPMLRKIKVNIAEKKFNVQEEEKKKQQNIKSELVINSTQDTLNTIDEVERGIGYFGAGSLIPAVPTLQPEKLKWQANLRKLLAGKVIDVMTSMKEASKTGATGFGQLSEKELKVLQDASTALKSTLSPKDAQEILSSMKITLDKVLQIKTSPIGTEMPHPLGGQDTTQSIPQPGQMFNGQKIRSIKIIGRK